jgi:FMN phosphatase YigB (HAD superfamily)
MAATPQFIYFDLGKVLLDYSVERMCAQVAAAAGIAVELVDKTLFNDGLMLRHETGQIDARGLHEAFCQATGANPDFDALRLAAADIFEPIQQSIALAEQLRAAGHRLGILSNTCQTHWDYCIEHYPMLSKYFAVHALSHRIGALKPRAEIFHAAAEMAGCPAERIFFVDDIAGHIAGALAVGFDAVQFTSPDALAEELRRRGVAVDGHFATR